MVRCGWTVKAETPRAVGIGGFCFQKNASSGATELVQASQQRLELGPVGPIHHRAFRHVGNAEAQGDWPEEDLSAGRETPVLDQCQAGDAPPEASLQLPPVPGLQQVTSGVIGDQPCPRIGIDDVLDACRTVICQF
jgi:hypothetical protein